MSVSIISVAAAYVLLAFLLLLAILKSEIGGGQKLLLCALCLGFYLWHYDALQQYPGWPADDDLPKRFELVSSYTVEPVLKNDQPGGVYLWLRDLDSEQAVPRSYRLPYRKALHRKVDDTLRKQREGERFVGTPVPAAVGSGNRARIEFNAVQRDSGSRKSAQ